MKGYTDYMSAFFGPEAIATKPIGEMKYMDWEKAERICKENPYAIVRAGLREDWIWTNGVIFDHGEYVRDYVFGCSCWATPIIDVDGEEIECWTYEETVEKENLPSWWGREEKEQ